MPYPVPRLGQVKVLLKIRHPRPAILTMPQVKVNPEILVVLMLPDEEVPLRALMAKNVVAPESDNTAWPAPAPLRVRLFPLQLIELVHVALPAETLIVSPFDALATQAATLARSGVAVQFGLAPVQAASVCDAPQMTKAATMRDAALTWTLFICPILSRASEPWKGAQRIWSSDDRADAYPPCQFVPGEAIRWLGKGMGKLLQSEKNWHHKSPRHQETRDLRIHGGTPD